MKSGWPVFGAFSVTQQESGRIIEQGGKLFDKLVAEAAALRKRTRKDVEGALDDFRGEVESRVEAINSKLKPCVDKPLTIGTSLKRYSKSGGTRTVRLGIPNKDDVTSLADKVQKLSREVADLESKTHPVSLKAKTAAKKVVQKSRCSQAQSQNGSQEGWVQKDCCSHPPSPKPKQRPKRVHPERPLFAKRLGRSL